MNVIQLDRSTPNKYVPSMYIIYCVEAVELFPVAVVNKGTCTRTMGISLHAEHVMGLVKHSLTAIVS